MAGRSDLHRTEPPEARFGLAFRRRVVQRRSVRCFLPTLLVILLGGACAATLGALPKRVTPVQAAAAEPLKRGDQVRVLRNQVLLFYGKPWGTAQAGTIMEVLDVRPAAGQVFVAVKDGDRVIAVSLPLQSIRSEKLLETAERVEQSTALFAGLIPKLNVKIAPETLEKLRKEPRQWVEVAIEEEGFGGHEHLGMKLKGSAGSFQQVDQRPGLSFNTKKFDGGERFHGVRRFQLNNCAQDDTALNELVSGEMARAAGVPASRCTHALVALNGRELGTYVLKEGFTDEFLAAFFKNTEGHLYDGGFCSDVKKDMELDRGDPESQESLEKLLAALAEADPEKQWALLSAIVDVDAYLRYLAMENILCHWDGYSFNRNNYRMYENPDTGKFHFILHGMDQMFAETRQSVERTPVSAVGAAIWRRPEMRERYWVILRDIYTRALKPIDWGARVQEHGRRLLAALPADRAKDYEALVRAETEKVVARLQDVGRQLGAPRLGPTLAAKGSVNLGAAAWVQQVENAEGDEVVEDRRPSFHLKATGEANASWRLSFMVPAGKYRFTARLKTRTLDPLTTESGHGAGLRISGGTRQGQPSLQGSVAWRQMTFDFAAGAGREVTLVAEMRAKSGELWIERDSLRLARIP